MKYVVVTGGVVSGLGKGISISSLGVLLKASGYRVTSIKIDPYLNTDAGTMSPFEHGEVFVLDDGGESDLDLGNYERFLNVRLTRDHNITTGKVYYQVIRGERRGDFLGKTVQVIPHVTDAIQDWIERVAHQAVDGASTAPDICLVEVGGTVGDIESLVFLEALRQFSLRVGPSNIAFVHVSLVPVVGAVGELKTKPTQHSIKELRSVGISPDIILCRSTEKLNRSIREKLALFCQVPPGAVLSVYDVSNIYHVPLLLHAQAAEERILNKLGLKPRVPITDEIKHIDAPGSLSKVSSSTGPAVLNAWRALANRVDNVTDEVVISLVGKYTGLQDAYLSVSKALKHASIACARQLKLHWIEAIDLEPQTKEKNPDAYAEAWKNLKSSHGVLVPGGFGERGVEGKLLAIRYAREKKRPYLGICLGMQLAVIEFCRNVMGWENAHSEEFSGGATARESKNVVVFMPEINPREMGGTMRLGARPTIISPGGVGMDDDTSEEKKLDDTKPITLTEVLYPKQKAILERHRHRYEVNPDCIREIQEAGLRFIGSDERKQRIEIIELPRKPRSYY